MIFYLFFISVKKNSNIIKDKTHIDQKGVGWSQKWIVLPTTFNIQSKQNRKKKTQDNHNKFNQLDNVCVCVCDLLKMWLLDLL